MITKRIEGEADQLDKVTKPGSATMRGRVLCVAELEGNNARPKRKTRKVNGENAPPPIPYVGNMVLVSLATESLSGIPLSHANVLIVAEPNKHDILLVYMINN